MRFFSLSYQHLFSLSLSFAHSTNNMVSSILLFISSSMHARYLRCSSLVALLKYLSRPHCCWFFSLFWRAARMEDTDLVHGHFMRLADVVLISLLELHFKDLASML